MKTKKIYYTDPYQVEFDANLCEVLKDEKGYKITLDQTSFYPEGGGQPADKGWIDGKDVLDVKKQGDVVYHYMTEEPQGPQVQGKIDWAHRKEYMQQHTGQHIISAVLKKLCNFDTLSVHMGEQITTIEIDTLEISKEQIHTVESLANAIVCENKPLESNWVDQESLHKYSLRRQTAKKGEVRVVSIEETDSVACGGVHCRETGEVGLIKSVGVEKIRGHVRTIWKIGDRAFKDYNEKNEIISELKTILSTGEQEIVRSVTLLKESLALSERKNKQIESELAQEIARSIASQKGVSGNYIYGNIWHDKSISLVKKIVQELITKRKARVCFLTQANDSLHWIIGCGENGTIDFNRVRSELLPLIDGKGGGYSPLWQGIGTNYAGAEEFLKRFKTLCS